MTYYVCSDKIDKKEQSYINAVISALKSKGKNAVDGGIGPNKEALRNSKGSGDTIVFIVGGGAAGCTLASFVKSVEGKTNYAHAIFGYAGWTSNPHVKEQAARTEKLVREHDCNFFRSWMPSYYEGHTIYTFCEKYSQYVSVCCSDKSAEDLGQKIANGTCGKSGDDSNEGGSASTIKDAIKEVLAYWDAEAECYIRDNKMYIHKIKPPAKGALQGFTDTDGVTTYLEVTLQSGVNIQQDSVQITDYNPDTVNVLTVHSEVLDDIIYRNEKLIERFGEKPQELDAVKKVQVVETVETPATDTTTTDTEIVDDATVTEPETTTTSTTKTEEVPCETPEEVRSFADREWAKIKRNNGHTIELKTQSAPQWQTGEWVKVEIPLFDVDDYLYIKSVSQSLSDGTECNLSLTDYPPGFGEYNPDTSDDEEENTEEEEETAETDVEESV